MCGSLPGRLWLSAALLWAAAWSAFAGLASSGEDWRGRTLAAAFSLAAIGPVVLAWKRPRLGGLVMLMLGCAASQTFHSRAAMLGLAIPAMLFGLGFLLGGVLRARRRRSRRQGDRRGGAGD